MSQQIGQLTCPIHQGQQIEYYCFEQCCPDRRLLCYNCLQSNQHNQHRPKVFQLSRINDQTANLKRQCQNLIDSCLTSKFTLIDSINGLELILKQKYQQSYNNITNFTYAQLESYLKGLLSFQEDQLIVNNDALNYITLANTNIQSTIEQLKLNQVLHYQAPPEDLAQVLRLQQRANDLISRGDQYQAQAMMEQTLRLDPNNTVTLTQLGNLLISNANFKGADYNFEKVLKLDPQNIEAKIGLGDALRIRYKIPEALDQYEAVLQQDRNNQKALLGKAHCLTKLKKFNEAKQIYQNVNFQNNIEAIWGQAEILRLDKKETQAINLYKQALRQNEKHVDSISGIGDCYRLREEFSDAMQFLRQAYELNPKHVINLTRMGDCLRQNKKYGEAIIYYKEAQAIDPEDRWIQDQLEFCKKQLR